LFSLKLIKLHTVNSTQEYLKKIVGDSSPDTVLAVWAETQTKGKGQRGNSWYSEPGKNLTFSVFIPNINLPAERFFDIHKGISLIIIDTLNTYYPGFQIKWPNDIMADGKKIAGILLDSGIRRGKIDYIITGIGININQNKFPQEAGKAVSLYELTGKKQSLDDIFYRFSDSLLTLNQYLKDPEALHKEYLKNLYLLQKKHTFCILD